MTPIEAAIKQACAIARIDGVHKVILTIAPPLYAEYARQAGRQIAEIEMAKETEQTLKVVQL